MQIIPFREDHLEPCAQLFVKVFSGAPWREAWSFPGAHRRLRDVFFAPGSLGLAGVIGDVPVGFVLGRIEWYVNEEHFHLQEMCVDPAWQGQGYGTRLLRQLHDELAGRGIRQVYLLTLGDFPAEAFYRRNGYVRARRAVLMVRRDSS